MEALNFLIGLAVWSVLLLAAAAFILSDSAGAGQFCGPVCVSKRINADGTYTCLRWEQRCGRSYP